MTLVNRYLGGESGHRSFFGGTVPKARIVGLSIAAAVFCTTPLFKLWAVAAGLLIAGVTIVATLKTDRGSYLERRTRRIRWSARQAEGWDSFEPYDPERWEQLLQVLDSAQGRKAKTAAARELARMRANPDGADGMGWLQMGQKVAGIAWHAPNGEPAYLSVAFEVSGHLRGLESNAVLNGGAGAWGRLQAICAKPSSLVRDVQPLTRVLPSDSTLLAHWAQQMVDSNAPTDAVESYAQAIRLTSDGSMIQRHFVAARWPLSQRFKDTAARYGTGRDGWRALMRDEIRSFAKELRRAKVGRVEVLSARRAAGLILHQQNPSRPLDYIRDVDPTRFGIGSHDEYSAHVVEGTDPFTGAPAIWQHRTAAILSEHLDVGKRNPLWVMRALKGDELRCIRTVTFHNKLIAKQEAAAVTRKDVTRDASEAISDKEAGKLDDGETSMNLSAARRRHLDLKPGTPHQGVEWIGFVTLTAPDRDALAGACRQVQDVFAAELGINKLDWQDSFQSSASGTTWPICRGQSEVKPSYGTKLMDRLAGRTDREAIS